MSSSPGPSPTPSPPEGRSDRAARALRRATGVLSSAATARMEGELAWFSSLSAQDRSWVGLIVQAGIRDFVDWYAGHDATDGRAPLAASVFGAAPRELTGVINLQQTVDLIRLAIETVEANVDEILDPRDAEGVHRSILRYGREVAFATAEVYARAAESRGAWDARLEALVVDAVLRAEADETVLSRASALGWAPAATCWWCSATCPRGVPTPTCSRRYAAPQPPRASTRSAPRRASAWWSCSAASATR